MKRRYPALVMLLAAASLALASSHAALAYDYTYARVVRLSLAEGDVQLARPSAPTDEQTNTAPWEQAVVNTPLQQGYTLATGQGRAEIEFESGATARLADNSVLQFAELALSNGARITRLTLTQGTATFYANLSRDDSFVVDTPHLRVAIPHNARFRVDVSSDGSSVSALKGDVEVDSRAGTTSLTKGNSLSYRADDPDRVSIDRTRTTDDWDRWVADRDEVIHSSSTAALQYVSSPYSYGLADLYNYGAWYPFGSYGLCWRPYGVGFGWSPFWAGRWGFFPGLGWTWISYEPWGWLPYHFGRWVFSPTLGWLWVPGHFRAWQPALVSWVRIGNRTGWVPLHPNDRPGLTPANLQQGVVLTGAGTNGTHNLERRIIARQERVEVVDAPPRGFAAVPRSATSNTGGTPPVTPGGSGSQQQGGIVFDPGERRFVNNPGRGAKNGDVGDMPIDTDRIAPHRGAAGIAPPKPSRGPAGGPGGVPTGDSNAPSGRISPPPPQQQQPPPAPKVQPPPPPPRMQPPAAPKPDRIERMAPEGEVPRARPVPRAEPPPPRARVQPPPPAPRVERMERVAPRSEAPHVMPMPHMESAPRTSPPPQPAPRSAPSHESRHARPQ